MTAALVAVAACGGADEPYGSLGFPLISGGVEDVVWSTDGQTLVYSQLGQAARSTTGGVFVFSRGTGGFWSIGPNAATRLAGQPGAGQVYGLFRPRQETRSGTVERIAVDGTSPQVVAFGAAAVAAAPDGGRVAWSTAGVLTVHDEGSPLPNPRGNPGVIACVPVLFSPDGARILCRERHIVDVADGRTTPIAYDGSLAEVGTLENAARLHWDEEGLWILDVAGQRVRLVNVFTGATTMPDRRNYGPYRVVRAIFSTDGREVYLTLWRCVEQRGEACLESQIELRRVPRTGGQSDLLLRTANLDEVFAVPGGRELLISAQAQTFLHNLGP